MRLGALDFLTKPVDMDHLLAVVRRALREASLVEEVDHLRKKLQAQHTFGTIVSKSSAMKKIFELVDQLGKVSTTVLIQGETGTGKERIARAIHEASRETRPGPLVTVNCAAVPEQLFESELFGHEKGSFTGASDRRKGKFEQAHGGTLFLDEIGELPMSLQPKLLRALQERSFERVGGAQTVPVDVRVVAATNQSLDRLVRKSRFREDLFYRLNVVTLDIPPLRARPEDVPLLVDYFSSQFAPAGSTPKTFTAEALQALVSHRWRGNVRELENMMERVAVTVPSDVVNRADLPLAAALDSPRTRIPIDLSRPLPQLINEATTELEKRYLKQALEKTGGSVGKCAMLAGMSRRSISSKLAEYGLDKRTYRALDPRAG
jgi:DNA-binding NtrC family response regulator